MQCEFEKCSSSYLIEIPKFVQFNDKNAKKKRKRRIVARDYDIYTSRSKLKLLDC